MSRPVPPDHLPFADADLVVGTSRRFSPYLVLLLLAVAADGIAFYQVVGLLVNEDWWVLVPLVLGFTGLALGLSHLVGVLARRVTERATPAVGAPTLALMAVWVFMGAVCFFVRATNTPAVQGSGPFGVLGSSAAGATSGGDPAGHTGLSTALLFLGLYLAGGLVAAVAAYLSHNPLAAAYRKALLRRTEARKEVQLLTPRHVRAVHRHQQELPERERDHRRWELATEERLGWADELKHYARFLMAVHLADPAATDGLTDSGDRLVARDWKGPDLRAAHLPEEIDDEDGRGAAA